MPPRKKAPEPPFGLGDDELTEIDQSLYSDADLDADLAQAYEELTEPGSSPMLDLDLFEDSNVDSRKVVLEPTDPRTPRYVEPLPPDTGSATAFRDVKYAPRAALPLDEVLSGMESALRLAQMNRGKLDRVRLLLKADLFPLLSQAVEQAGGDGLDAYLNAVFDPPGSDADDPLLGELINHMQALHQAKSTDEMFAAVRGMVDSAEAAFEEPRRLSLKLVELELEGRLEVDVVLSIALANDEELIGRFERVDRALESLREQVRELPGAFPAGMFWNFSRLKTELRLLEAEVQRRGLEPGEAED